MNFDWKGKRYPSLEHCQTVLAELERLRARWEQIKTLTKLLQQRTAQQDDTDFTNPVQDAE